MSHQCFRKGCREIVPDRLLACKSDWFLLQLNTRLNIHSTLGLPLLDPLRREALKQAQEDWSLLD